MKRPLPPAVTRIVAQRGLNDCAVACLAMFLHVDYEEALLAAGRVTRYVWTRGLRGPQVVRTAAKLGVATHWVRYIPDNEDTGILWLQYREKGIDEHTVFLDGGVIFDPSHSPVSRWEDPQDYFTFYHVDPLSILRRIT